MALAHHDEGLREDVDFRRWLLERRLAELRLERATYRILLITVAVFLCTYALLFANLHKYCMNKSKTNLSSLLV